MKPAVKPEYEFIQHMIKGVAFFGTPFQGSRNGDLLAPLAGLVAGITRMSTSFVDDMKTYSKDIPSLMMMFNRIRTEEEIEVLLFVEGKQDGPSKVVHELSTY
jgi:hypothetical protein